MGLSVCGITIIYLYNIVEHINVPKGSRQSVFSNMQTSVVALYYYEFHSWSRVTSKTQTTPHAWRIPCVFFPSLFLSSLSLSMRFFFIFIYNSDFVYVFDWQCFRSVISPRVQHRHHTCTPFEWIDSLQLAVTLTFTFIVIRRKKNIKSNDFIHQDDCIRNTKRQT